jgi:amylosucrase
MHRPAMDWQAAERRAEDGALEARVFGMMRRLAEARRSQVALRAGAGTLVLHSGNTHVLAYQRRHERGDALLVAANFSDDPQAVPWWVLHSARVGNPELVHSTTGTLDLHGGELHLPAWGFAWITGR